MASNAGEDTLDAWILAENKVVTYRLLSRLLRVKGQLARDIMNAWHVKRPTSHATFVLCGHRSVKPDASTNGSHAASDPSPLNPSSMISHQSVDGVWQTSIQLVPEEQLEQVKARFDSISYCLIYSLEPGKLSDIRLLASCKEDVAEAMQGQSTKIADLSETYEIIFNAQVDELDKSGSTDRVQQRQMKPIFKRDESTDKQQTVASNDLPPAAADTNTITAPAKETKVAAPALKRGPSNSLASAFAKTPKSKPKSMAAPSLSRTNSSKEEPVVKTESLAPAKPRESLKQREETSALRDMMMEDDQTEPNSQEPMASQSKEDSIMDDNELEADWSASDTEMKDAPAIAEPPARRRGRKKVKRQVHTKDAKGYMVTKEEWEWVSCDEEEVAAPQPPPALLKQSSIASSKSKGSTTTTAQTKKKTAGGIASYFTKK